MKLPIARTIGPYLQTVTMGLILVLSTSFTQAQEKTTPAPVPVGNESFAIELLDQQILDKGRGITQVFLLSEKHQIHHLGKPEPIVVPEEIAGAETGYFRIYFTGRKGKLEKWIAVLIADFRSESPKYYVDLNNNLDFTDDSTIQPAKNNDGSVVIELLGDAKESKFAIKLHPFRHEKDLSKSTKERYASLFAGMKKYMGGEFAGTDYWFYDRRLTTRTNSVEVAGTKILIGLHDYDCDGQFSGERDRLLVGEHGAQNISYKLAEGAINVKAGEVFLIGNEPFQLVHAAADGSRVSIAKSDTMPNRLFAGMPLPKIELKRFDGETFDVRELIQPGKLLVLDFWGHWCGPCVEAVPSTLEFHERWKEKIVIAGIHMGDHDAAKKIISDQNIPWPQFEYSDELKEMLFIDAWPTYIVIDDNGNLLSFNSPLKDIPKFLQK